MSRPALESFVVTTDLLVRVFAILAAISALLYVVSNRELQKLHRQKVAAGALPVKQEEAKSAGDALDAAQTQIQKLKTDNSNLSAELQQEHEARLLTQWRLGPRFIPAPARAEMMATLQPFAGNRLNFGYFTDLETAAFAEELLDTLKSSGWKPQVFKIKIIQPIYGIECGGPNPQDPALQALAEALKIIDQHLVPEEDGALPAGQTLEPPLTGQLQMWVLVGLKQPHLHKKPSGESAAQPPGESR